MVVSSYSYMREIVIFNKYLPKRILLMLFIDF